MENVYDSWLQAGGQTNVSLDAWGGRITKLCGSDH